MSGFDPKIRYQNQGESSELMVVRSPPLEDCFSAMLVPTRPVSSRPLNSMESQPTFRRIGVCEIAKQMGLSHATVSMALRNSVRISASTREKVQRHARDVGYRPDPMLKTLVHYRHSKATGVMKGAVAWINAWPAPDRLRSYREFDGYWKGAKAEAEKSGYGLEEFRMGPECSPTRLHRTLEARGIRGIMLPPHAEQPDWEDFPWKDYAVVRIGRSLKFPVTHLTASDQMGNAMLACASMRDRGYRRVGFVTGRFELVPHGHLFGVGWLAAQAMVPEEERVPAFTFMVHPVEKRTEFFRRWLDDYRPDAILSDVPEIFDLLKQADKKVPQDLGLAMTSVLDGGADSGIDQHAEEIGRTAFLMLNSLISEGAKGELEVLRQLVVEGEWVDGTSLPRKNHP
jgi:LacI family transcriptional regulator